MIFSFLQWDKEIQSLSFLHFKPVDTKNPSVRLPLIPMQMEGAVETTGWLGVFILQAIFVLRGLPWPCCQPDQHYVNCLLLKIRFAFCWLCLTLTATICAFSILY